MKATATVSKLDLAVVVVAIAGGALWIEQGHRVVIDAPVAEAAVASAACSDSDAVPYSAACLEYLKAAPEPAPRPRVVAVAPAPCPDNDRVPYSASCIAFMASGTETGMRWRPTAGPPSIPAPQ
ncbi:MAG: hypothetical protein K2Y71_09460 [Xanthobacteraceae bacterium]|nr:hypothetical protein [Xanthobacteraceae bacterium]